MKNLIILILFILVSTNINAQNDTPEDMIKVFFNNYKVQKTELAFDELFSSNKLFTSEDISSIKLKIAEYSKVLGQYHGQHLLIKEDINEIIQVHSYILKYEIQPIRFTFTFYKPSLKWKIQNFKISDDFIEEIEKATIKLGYETKTQ